MKILIIGDVFGNVGRRIVKNFIPRIKSEEQIDFVIANIENTTNGKSISYSHYLEMKDVGIDVMTSGNHIFAIDDVRNYIDKTSDLLRPLNMNPFHPGKGTALFLCKGKKIRVTNLIGNSFINPHSENPFFAFEKVFLEERSDIHIVDFHGETTAEKIAFALYYDGKISAFYGTHTHVQTADERILKKGTAFITDLGMTGPRDGVIGAKLEPVIKRSKYGFPARIEPNDDLGQFNGAIIEFDQLGKAISIKRINLKGEFYS